MLYCCVVALLLYTVHIRCILLLYILYLICEGLMRGLMWVSLIITVLGTDRLFFRGTLSQIYPSIHRNKQPCVSIFIANI